MLSRVQDVRVFESSNDVVTISSRSKQLDLPLTSDRRLPSSNQAEDEQLHPQHPYRMRKQVLQQDSDEFTLNGRIVHSQRFMSSNRAVDQSMALVYLSSGEIRAREECPLGLELPQIEELPSSRPDYRIEYRNDYEEESGESADGGATKSWKMQRSVQSKLKQTHRRSKRFDSSLSPVSLQSEASLKSDDSSGDDGQPEAPSWHSGHRGRHGKQRPDSFPVQNSRTHVVNTTNHYSHEEKRNNGGEVSSDESEDNDSAGSSRYGLSERLTVANAPRPQQNRRNMRNPTSSRHKNGVVKSTKLLKSSPKRTSDEGRSSSSDESGSFSVASSRSGQNVRHGKHRRATSTVHHSGRQMISTNHQRSRRARSEPVQKGMDGDMSSEESEVSDSATSSRNERKERRTAVNARRSRPKRTHANQENSSRHENKSAKSSRSRAKSRTPHSDHFNSDAHKNGSAAQRNSCAAPSGEAVVGDSVKPSRATQLPTDLLNEVAKIGRTDDMNGVTDSRTKRSPRLKVSHLLDDQVSNPVENTCVEAPGAPTSRPKRSPKVEADHAKRNSFADVDDQISSPANGPAPGATAGAATLQTKHSPKVEVEHSHSDVVQDQPVDRASSSLSADKSIGRLELKLQKEKKRVLEKMTQLLKEQGKNQQLHAKIEALENQLAAKDNELVKKVEETISEQEQRPSIVENEQTGRIKALKKQLQQKEADIARLEQANRQLEAALSRLKVAPNELESARHTNDQANYRTDVDSLTQRVRDFLVSVHRWKSASMQTLKSCGDQPGLATVLDRLWLDFPKFPDAGFTSLTENREGSAGQQLDNKEGDEQPDTLLFLKKRLRQREEELRQTHAKYVELKELCARQCVREADLQNFINEHRLRGNLTFSKKNTIANEPAAATPQDRANLGSNEPRSREVGRRSTTTAKKSREGIAAARHHISNVKEDNSSEVSKNREDRDDSNTDGVCSEKDEDNEDSDVDLYAAKQEDNDDYEDEDAEEDEDVEYSVQPPRVSVRVHRVGGSGHLGPPKSALSGSAAAVRNRSKRAPQLGHKRQERQPPQKVERIRLEPSPTLTQRSSQRSSIRSTGQLSKASTATPKGSRVQQESSRYHPGQSRGLNECPPGCGSRPSYNRKRIPSAMQRAKPKQPVAASTASKGAIGVIRPWM